MTQDELVERCARAIHAADFDHPHLHAEAYAMLTADALELYRDFARAVIPIIVSACAGAVCYGCAHNWPLGYSVFDNEKSVPLHHSPSTDGGWTKVPGHRCVASAIRALSPQEEVKP